MKASVTLPNHRAPSFEHQVLEASRPDGYWIQAFKSKASDRLPGLIAYGLASGTIGWYLNPGKSGGPWEKRIIQQLVEPVGMDVADVTGNGYNDVIICHRYGKTMVHCDSEGGHISWLENPTEKATTTGHWKERYIGRAVSMHRLRVGHFTRPDKLQIIAMPIVGRPFDLTSATPVLLFTRPDDVLSATEWPCGVISRGYFHVIHDAKVKKFSSPAEGRPSLDTLFVSSGEGITWLHYDDVNGRWIHERIGEGELGESEQTGFRGSGGVDIGRLRGQDIGYIAACEPFHGNKLALYLRPAGDDRFSVPLWRRLVIDSYGPVDENGEGPAHFVVTGDFDGDGEDEILVALRGAAPYQGVFYYKVLNAERGFVARWHVSKESAARIATGDFKGDGLLHYATISYNVPLYYEDKHPSVNMYHNVMGSLPPSSSAIRVAVDSSGALQASAPELAAISDFVSVPWLDVGGMRLALELLPRRSSRMVTNRVGIKVLAGRVFWIDRGVKKIRTAFASPKTISSIFVSSDSNRIQTEEEGAVILSVSLTMGRTKFEDLEHITLTNILPDGTPQTALQHSFAWRPYGDIDSRFAELAFFNVKGIRLTRPDDSLLCNIQLWAAGKRVDCGLHNHATDHFCEVHACLVNGTGSGGMTYGAALDLDAQQIALPVPTMAEHGPLWEIAVDGKPKQRNGAVVYPYHRWQGGSDSAEGESFDVWIAFEFNPSLATIHV